MWPSENNLIISFFIYRNIILVYKIRRKKKLRNFSKLFFLTFFSNSIQSLFLKKIILQNEHVKHVKDEIEE